MLTGSGRISKAKQKQVSRTKNNDQTLSPPGSQQDEYLLLPEFRTSRRSSPSSRSQRSRSAQSTQASDSSDRGDQESNRLKLSRKRASKPKVRTGCISCKRRHVKCDEGKPSCAECDRLGLMCEGYAPPKTKITMSRPERLLLPKPKPLIQGPIGTTEAPPQPVNYLPAAVPMPSFRFESSEDDQWYFTLFRDQIVQELSPYYQSSFWSQTSLRDSTVNKCIHHSILSIGAYGRALMDLKNESSVNGRVSRTWWPSSVPNRHQQAALAHHDKALSHLQSTIRSCGIDGRLTMVATLLFIVFENMQGNYHSSGSLIRSGIKVLTNIRNQGMDSRSILRRQWHRYLTTPQDEVDEMTNMFARHSIASAYLPFSHGKFAYHMLFNEEDDDDDMNLGTAEPFTFTIPRTINEARQIWDYLALQLADFQNKVAWHNQNPDYDFDSPAAYREQAVYLALLNDLGVGLDSLLFSPVSMRESQGLELLRLHHTIAVISVSCCLDASEMLYDEFLPQFEDVIQRCRLFAKFASADTPANKVRVGFTNEAGTLPLLAFVGAKCRTARVRASAVELMGSAGGREGIWDSSSLAGAVVGIMRLEGQLEPLGSARLVPAASARYTWSNVFWDFEKQQMHVEYTKLLPNELGEHEKVKYVISV
ncbi:hypothetical protein M426DRAFT_317778 [Hypoxylon sp. CI-4A]|nr:hypothetical protein M426DRAFT_317778 [Hypoxylon sp. CI-4A]